MRDEDQIALLNGFCAKYKREFDRFCDVERQDSSYRLSNSAFGPVDAEILYSTVRHFRPRNIVEIGSGNSTLLFAEALEKNRTETGQACELTAIEPYPNQTLITGFPGLTKLLRVPVQRVALTEFERLVANDILFIDSSHVLKTGSDVQYEFLEILPRLQCGVLVHIHDIFLPNEYPRAWVVDELRFWNEQYILQAFLSFNSAFEVLWAGSYMNTNHPELLRTAFASYGDGKRVPGSFWIRKVR
ncbi:MAG: class I SAM-dependent methyltransferase [Candidatus Acidiferrales bacterium]